MPSWNWLPNPSGILLSLVDILIVAYLLYRLLLLLRQTGALQLAQGIVILVVATQVSEYLNLGTTHLVLQTAQVGLLVALPVIFQPELRRALVEIGRGRFFTEAPLAQLPGETRDRVLREVVSAVERLARARRGAIIAMEREADLQGYAETGVRMEARVSAELLESIFLPGTPLHDGAVIIRGERVLAAATFLPLADPRGLPVELGSRHRAGLGLSAETDALVIIVSEEKGVVSVALQGRLLRPLDEIELMDVLLSNFQPARLGRRGILRRVKKS